MARVHNQAGSKERLMEMFQRVNKISINENHSNNKARIDKFMNFVSSNPDVYKRFRDMINNHLSTESMPDDEIMDELKIAVQNILNSLEKDDSANELPEFNAALDSNNLDVLYKYIEDEIYFEAGSRYDSMMASRFESFDVNAEHDKEYLNKVGDEKAYDEQPNKYDGGVRYPSEDKLKLDDPSLEEEENLDEISWAGVKQAGKFVGQSILNLINNIGGAIESYGNDIVKNYNNGDRNDAIRKLEKLGAEFGKKFAIQLNKLNTAIEKNGEEPISAQKLVSSISNQIVSNTRKGNSQVDLIGKYGKDVTNKPLPKKEGIHEDELEGGLADEKEPIQYDADQIMKGMKVEMEHTNDPKIALEIAMDHLEEIPDYYDHLEDMEVEATGDKNVGDVEEDDRSADPLLYPTMKIGFGEAFGFNPNDPDIEAGETEYEEMENLKKLNVGDNLQFDYDRKGNFIPKGFEDKNIALKQVEQPMGSGNEKILVVTLDNEGGVDDVVATKDSWDDAKVALIDYIS